MNEKLFIKNIINNITIKVTQHDHIYLPLCNNYLQTTKQVNKYFRVNNCSTIWNIKTYKTGRDKLKYRTIFRNACNLITCNICSWQQHKKNKNIIANKIKDLVYKHKYKLIFLRLSNTAVADADLDLSLKALQKACNTLLSNRLVRKSIKGYIKKLEITYNPDTNKYNPHYHILLVMEENYFKNNFINHHEWLALWRRYTYNPKANINIQNRINIKQNKIYSLSNYISKPVFNYNNPPTQKEFNAISHSLVGKQVLRFVGVCKSSH